MATPSRLAHFLFQFALPAALTLVPMASRAGLAEGLEAYHHGPYALALNELTPLAAHGDPEAMLALGEMKQFGLGTARDVKAGWSLVYKAAEAGNTAAMVKVGGGWLYGSDGLGNGQADEKLATQWYLRAAKAGNTKAMLEIGEGSLSTVSVDDQFAWLSKAAQMRNGRACSALVGELVLGKQFKDATEVAAYIAKVPDRFMVETPSPSLVRAAALGFLVDAYTRGDMGVPVSPGAAQAMMTLLSEEPDLATYKGSPLSNAEVDELHRLGMPIPETVGATRAAQARLMQAKLSTVDKEVSEMMLSGWRDSTKRIAAQLAAAQAD